MTNSELRDLRFCIAIESLQKGLEIPYKIGWRLIYTEGVLYQKFHNVDENKEIVHKSLVSLNSFLGFIDRINDNDLKRMYGNNKLKSLQDKLIDRDES